MTNWLPEVPAGAGPFYVRLADGIEADIGSGALPGGAKLPPQRNLAFDLGVTIGTIGRAYALLRQRGLVSGEVGRGTYVLGKRDGAEKNPAEVPPAMAGTRIATSESKLQLDTTAAPDVGQAAIFGRITAEIFRDRTADIPGYVRRAPASWAEAGCRWLSTGAWSPDPASIVPTLGGHPAILGVIAAATAPGDRIVFEQLTYSHVARSASLMGRRILPAEADDQGMDPEHFDRLCAQQHPRLVFLMPGLHNPTLAVMPESRRRDIVEIARRHNVWIVEDAIYGALVDEPLTPIAELAPERTFHIGSLSKAVAAGLRGGWTACPPHFAPRVLTAYGMLTGGTPFLLAELAARLVLSGEAEALRQRVRDEIAAREAIARDTFAGCDFVSHRHAPFLWMKLPEPWLPATFKQAAANEDLLIDDEDEFKSGRTEANFHRVRLGFSVPPREKVAEAFARLRVLLDSGIAGYDRFG